MTVLAGRSSSATSRPQAWPRSSDPGASSIRGDGSSWCRAMRSSALVAAIVVVLAAGCGSQSNDKGAQDTDTDPPPVSTEPTGTGSGDIQLACANPTVIQVDHFSDVGGNPDPVKAARAQLGK